MKNFKNKLSAILSAAVIMISAAADISTGTPVSAAEAIKDGAVYTMSPKCASNCFVGAVGADNQSNVCLMTKTDIPFINWEAHKYTYNKKTCYYFVNRPLSILNNNKTMVLDVEGDKPKSQSNVQLYSLKNGKPNATQLFYVTANSDGTICLKSVAANSNLDVYGDSNFRYGTNIQVYKPNGNSTQRFKLSKVSDNGKDSGKKTDSKPVITENKKYNMTGTNRAVVIVPRYMNYPGNRSAEAYNIILNQLAVESNPRYKKYTDARGLHTFCNIYVTDAMNCFGILSSYSHINNINTKEPVKKWVNGATEEMNCLKHLEWLNKYGKKYGWKKVSASEAQKKANAGYPTIVLTKTHTAVVRPETAKFRYSKENGVIIAQAGGYNVNYGKAKTYFGTLNGLTYWTHD